MPRAGWCRECGEWVWVDQEGACQNGHGPECVGGIYEAAEQSEPAPIAAPDFGVGEMPAHLNRFNWGAFLLPLPWGIGYGVWSVVSLWILMALTPLVLSVLVSSMGEQELTASMLGVGIVSEVISGVIRLWIGANATRLLWLRESVRLSVVQNARPRFSAEKYLARQRVWLVVGLGISAMALMGLAALALAHDPVTAALRAQQKITPVDAGLAAFWLVAEAVLGLWLAAKMRHGGSDVTQATDGV